MISRLVSDVFRDDLAKAARDTFPAATRTVAYSPRTALPTDASAVPVDAILLLDTTVYIDGMKRAGLPADIQTLLANRVIRHSGICMGELGFGFGRLDPAHRDTARNQSAISDVLSQLAPASFVSLSPSGWARAGVLAGALARLQGFAQDRRCALFLDAALFVTAEEHGLTLVSGNFTDMDLLLQVGGKAKVLLYGMERTHPIPVHA
jgi:hypothetical protein